MNKDFIFGLITFIFGLFIIWTVGYFITFNPIWFYSTITGRVLAIIFIIIDVNAVANDSN